MIECASCQRIYTSRDSALIVLVSHGGAIFGCNKRGTDECRSRVPATNSSVLRMSGCFLMLISMSSSKK